MFDIFLLPYNTHSRMTNPSLERYLEVYGYVLKKVVEYYREENFYVKRPNPLIGLLQNMRIGPSLSKQDVINYLDTNAEYISRNYDIVSNGNTGDILHNVITHNSNEIFILTSLYDPFEINESNYIDISPIRCIYNTDNMLNISHPYRIKHLTGSDIVMYELDLTALGLQYYYWSKEQIKIERDTDIGRFLYAIPFTNLIYSYSNITLFNIFMDLWDNKDIPDTVSYNPLYTMDPSKNIIHGYEDLIKNLKRNENILYVDFLNSIPVVNKTALEALRINKIYYTLQDRWTLWLSRIEYINWLLDSLGTTGMKRNEKYVKDLLIDIKNNERDGTFRKMPKNIIVDTFFSIMLTELENKIKYNL